jgi:hypothetical protein
MTIFPYERHSPARSEGSFRAISRREQMQQINSLLDHLVGTDSRLGSNEIGWASQRS